MENRKYKVVIAQSGKLDVKEKKKYILQQFKYREYAENFSKKIKKAVLALDTLPTGYNTTGFRYRGYENSGYAGWDGLAVYYQSVAAGKRIGYAEKISSDRQYSDRLGITCFYVR